MHFSRVGIFLLLGVAGCTAGGRVVPASEPTRIQQGSHLFGYRVVVDENTGEMIFMLKMDQETAWRSLLEAYEATDIPLGVVSTRDRTMGNPALVVRGRLGGTPLSDFVDCGIILGGPAANVYRVQLSVLSSLRPAAGDSVQLRTRVRATASDPGQSSPATQCTSTGKLEERIADQIGSERAER